MTESSLKLLNKLARETWGECIIVVNSDEVCISTKAGIVLLIREMLGVRPLTVALFLLKGSYVSVD